LSLFLGAAACETAKSANPLSPAIAGPIEGVNLTQPKGLEPLPNQQIKDKDQPFTVIIENPSSDSPRPFVLRMQIATDINFASVVWTRDGIEPGANGRTTFRMPERLQPGRNYFWRTQADDGANQSAWSAPLGFEILMPTKFGKPTPREPVNNQQVATNRPVLRVDNASAEGPVGQAYYHFQVSRNASFSDLVVNQQTPQQGGETKLTTSALAYSATYYWRVRVSDGETTGDWSETETFRTGTTPAPSPGPSDPGPGTGNACGAPYPSTPLSIIQCQRSKYGYMSSSQLVSFLTASSKDLNANGHSGGPFGLLVKTGGHNCLGFSCDIICSGNGGTQRQWDVLIDGEGAQKPVWNEVGSIAIRTCQIQ
jgi:hypothetical protein